MVYSVRWDLSRVTWPKRLRRSETWRLVSVHWHNSPNRPVDSSECELPRSKDRSASVHESRRRDDAGDYGTADVDVDGTAHVDACLDEGQRDGVTKRR